MSTQHDLLINAASARLADVSIDDSRRPALTPIIDQLFEFSAILNSIDPGEVPTAITFNPLWED